MPSLDGIAERSPVGCSNRDYHQAAGRHGQEGDAARAGLHWRLAKNPIQATTIKRCVSMAHPVYATLPAGKMALHCHLPDSSRR
jgi:hypothetical protein